MRTIMNKKLALLSILPVAVLAVAVPALSNNTAALQLQAETPTPTTRSIEFNDFSDSNFSFHGGDEYWCLNRDTGNYLGLHGENIRSATNTSITLEHNGYLQNANVDEKAGQRKYQIGLISALTVKYSGSGSLKYDTGGNKIDIISETGISFIIPTSNLTISNPHSELITITSIVIQYKC